jgi:hypothetical protein
MEQWHPQGLQAPLDGFEVLRRGDQNLNCRIVLHVNHYPEKFRILPPLSEIIAMNEGTRAEAMSAVWKLVKTIGAQDKDDGSILKRVGDLEKVGSCLQSIADGRFFRQLQRRSRSTNYPSMLHDICPTQNQSSYRILSRLIEISTFIRNASISPSNWKTRSRARCRRSC